MPPEGDLIKEALEELTIRGIPAVRINTRVVTGKYPNGKPLFFRACYRADGKTRGVPDILGCLPGGKVLAAEAKMGKGKASPEQQEFLDAIRRVGGVAVVFHSVEELVDAIEEE